MQTHPQAQHPHEPHCDAVPFPRFLQQTHAPIEVVDEQWHWLQRFAQGNREYRSDAFDPRRAECGVDTLRIRFEFPDDDPAQWRGEKNPSVRIAVSPSSSRVVVTPMNLARSAPAPGGLAGNSSEE
jgi:hypothetical protein